MTVCLFQIIWHCFCFHFCLFSDFSVDCKDALKQAKANNRYADSGVYEIRLISTETIKVSCYMYADYDDHYDVQGWTVIQFLYSC
jgi:hypothetical protein